MCQRRLIKVSAFGTQHNLPPKPPLWANVSTRSTSKLSSCYKISATVFAVLKGNQSGTPGACQGRKGNVRGSDWGPDWVSPRPVPGIILLGQMQRSHWTRPARDYRQNTKEDYICNARENGAVHGRRAKGNV